MTSRHLGIAALLLASLGLGGCYDSNNCVYYCNADPSGVYEGAITDGVTNASAAAVAIVAENGDATLSAQDGSYYRFSVYTSGYDVGGSYQAYSAGSTVTSSGTVSGTLTAAGLALNFNGANHHVVSATLNYDNVYNLSSSLPTLQGSWSWIPTDSNYNGVACPSGTPNCPPAGAPTLGISVSNAGSFTGSDGNNCSYTGNFNLIYTVLNAYAVDFTQTCGSGPAVSYSGLASYFPASGSGSNAIPAQLLFMADNGNGGQYRSFLMQ